MVVPVCAALWQGLMMSQVAIHLDRLPPVQVHGTVEIKNENSKQAEVEPQP